MRTHLRHLPLLALLLALLPAGACFWEGRSGLDPEALAAFDFESFQRGLEGYCNNDADLAVLSDPESGLAVEVEACSYECFLEELVSTCVTRCVEDELGLSEECARCYGDNTACSMDNCINDCLDGDSPACAACRDQFCTPSFDACSGVEG